MDVRDLKPHETRIIWITLAILFFFLYSYLPFFSPRNVYNSPDETANAYFATTFREQGTLRIHESLESIAGDRIRPRAITVRDGALVPESFHGLPVIYGMLSAVGERVLPFLTAFFAVLAVLAWRRTIAQIFGHCTGEFAGLLLFTAPAWWYWANRGLYHNVFFVSLLIFATYFFITKPIKLFSEKLPITNLDIIFSGFMLGLALWVRASEAMWVIPLTFILWLVYRKKIRWSEVTSFMVAFIVALIPFFIFNAALYGSPLQTGYVIPETASSMVQSMEPELLNQSSFFGFLYSSISSAIFPFGLHPRTALTNFMNYFVAFPWWMTAVLAFSLMWSGYQLLRGQLKKNEVVLLVIFLMLTGYLTTLYGSWIIHDNPDPSVVNISISYTRYWLPLFVLVTGIGGYGIAALRGQLRGWWIHLMPTALIVVLAIFSFHAVFLTPDDGLVAVSNRLVEYEAIRTDAVRYVPKDAIIIVDRGDKVFFPERRVMYPLRDPGTFSVLGTLGRRVSLFYYGITMKDDDFAAQNEKLELIGLHIAPQKTYTDSTLYRLENL